MEREINLLSDNELNAVVGGRMNLANLGNRPHVLPPGSISAGNSFAGKVARPPWSESSWRFASSRPFGEPREAASVGGLIHCSISKISLYLESAVLATSRFASLFNPRES